MTERAHSTVHARRALLVLAAIALPVVAHAGLARTGDAAVRFAAIGAGGLRITGKSGELRVVDGGGTVKFVAPLGSLKTGIDLRDNHLYKALQVRDYPNVELEVSRGSVKTPGAGATESGEADGRLQLHGKTKGIKFKYTARNEGGRIKVEGSFRIDIRDFGMEVPSYMGLKMRPEVDAGASFYVAEGK